MPQQQFVDSLSLSSLSLTVSLSHCLSLSRAHSACRPHASSTVPCLGVARRASAVAFRCSVGQNFLFVSFDTRRNRTCVPQRHILRVRRAHYNIVNDAINYNLIRTGGGGDGVAQEVDILDVAQAFAYCSRLSQPTVLRAPKGKLNRTVTRNCRLYRSLLIVTRLMRLHSMPSRLA